jgi:predicted DNA-binding transcriptional regulator AlpA
MKTDTETKTKAQNFENMTETTDTSTLLPQIDTILKRLDKIEATLNTWENQTTIPGTNLSHLLTTEQAMKATGYNDKQSFLQTMTRDKISHIRIHARKFAWDPENIKTWKETHTKNERKSYFKITYGKN